jgi:uncharacterized protein
LQRKAIFRPTKAIDATPRDQGVNFEAVTIMVNGERVTGWWIPAAQISAGHAPRASALYLHGSGFSLSANLPRILRLQEAGFNVLAIDYRGFGASDGDLPSEESAAADAHAAWAELGKRAPPNGARYIYGHSLGGAIAVDLATKVRDAAGLVVESSFTSVRELLPHTAYKWIPLAPVQTQFFDSLEKLPKICMPVLFFHGTNDYRIPTEMAQSLFDAAREPKRLEIVQGARHIDIPTRFNGQWRAAIARLLETTPLKCGG